MRSALLAAALLLLGAADDARAERIREFEVDLRVDERGELHAEERIVYDFEGAKRHGIYRDIPVRYGRGASADYRIHLDVVSVTDESGAKRPFLVSTEGRMRRIRIGSPKRKVSGVQEYRVAYRVSRGVLWFDEHDEIYWNATGTAWGVPIDAASARVHLPEAIADEVPFLCFTGARGSVESDCAGVWEPGVVDFTADRPLDAREGLTVVVAIPKGVLSEPSDAERRLLRASDFWHWSFALPVAAFLGFGTLWWFAGRDPSGPVAIPVRYEPPEDMTPAEMGTVLDERADLDDVTATILDLAVRGYLQIEEVQTKKFLFLSETDYHFHRSTKSATDLKPHEDRLLGGLFEGSPTVALSSLSTRFYTRLQMIQDSLYEEVSRKGRWFPTRPDNVRTLYAWIGASVPGILAMAALLGGNPPWVISWAACSGVAFFWARRMPRKTRRGRRARQHILGFKEFLERVERDRLERLGQRDIANFERLLPYAFVLGVADAWAEAFADLYTQPPSWYAGHSDGDFRPREFITRVGRSLDTVGSVMRSTPSGGSGGGSGSSGFSSGGGFSGGGFGGGGGGSW